MPVDYSKFDAIVDSDDDEKEEKKVVKKMSKCENCGKSGKLLKCRCRKVAYCSLDCQKKDYKFHKRICTGKVPEVPKKKPEPPKEKPVVTEAESSDEEELTWYRHRETKLPPSASGPSKIAAPPKPVVAQGSAWNAAGTWEERDVTKWVSDAVQESLRTATFEFVKCTGTKTDGDATVGVVRGSPRRFLDVNIAVAFEAQMDRLYKGNLHVQDFTHDARTETLEVHLELTDAPKISATTSANLKLALLGTNDATSLSVPPNVVDAAFAHNVVKRLRTDMLPKFLVLL